MAGVAATVGTVLLVVIAVAMATIVGTFMFTLVEMDEPTPEVGVVLSHDVNSWTIHVTSVDPPARINEFRLLVRSVTGDLVLFDSDGDQTIDSGIATDLDNIRTVVSERLQTYPVIYVDADADGRVNSGDFLTVSQPYFVPLSPLLDASHGYKSVGKAPDGIPRGSLLYIYTSPLTLGPGVVNPGDTVRVTLAKGGDVLYSTEGEADANGVFTASTLVPDEWVPATLMKGVFTIRPGQVDELVVEHSFKIMPDRPPTKAEREGYMLINYPIGRGDFLELIHTPSNANVLQVRL
jgi:hypothetical protein